METNTDQKKAFIHTHFHSNYSTKDSINKIKYAIAKVKADGQTAMAITDHGTIGGTLDFYDECLAQGIKPIIGCEVYMRCEQKLTENPRENYHLILLCKNLEGWKNLIKIVKQSHDDSYYVPLVTWENLEKHHSGLIATTACFAGPVANPIIYDRYDIAEDNLNKLIKLFGDDLYIEFQPNSISNQVKINTALYELCKKYNLKYTIGVDSHYIDKDDAKAQETLLGINFKANITDIPEHMAVDEEEGTDGARQKRRTRFAFSKEDFWLMTEDDIYKMWDDNHKMMGRNDFPGEAPHILLLMKAFENMKEIENKVETFSIYPDRSQMKTKYTLSEEDAKSPEFLKFLERDKDNRDGITLKFLRFLLEKSFFEKGLHHKINAQEYLDRIRKVELPDTIYAELVDYFLIVWDMIKHCKDEDILTGPGRGCLSGEEYVLTKDGYKKLKTIEIGDIVCSHTGNFKKVTNKMRYAINESTIRIKSQYSFGDIILTKDHKVLSAKQFRVNKNATYSKGSIDWHKAEDLKNGDLIFTPWPINREIISNEEIDLFKYCENKQKDNGNFISIRGIKRHSLSIKQISKNTGVPFESVRNLIVKNNQIKNDYISKIEEYCRKIGGNIEEAKKKYVQGEKKVKRFLKIDKDFCYFIGLWLGDGYCRTKGKGQVVFSFHKENKSKQAEWIVNYIESLGFSISKSNSGKNCVNLTICGNILSNMIFDLFPSYAENKTKEMGFLKKLNNDLIRQVIQGILDSDGHTLKVENKAKSIKNTSLKLILDIKECLLYLNIPSGIHSYKSKNNKEKISYNCLLSYGNKNISNGLDSEFQGYFSPITKISEEKNIKEVYDITVEDDASYLTTNGIVHNSAAGSLIGYLLNIHCVDPIQYGLLWERFYNAGRKDSQGDIDSDFPTSKRHLVLKYLLDKYGENNVSAISNYAFFRPKSTFKAVCAFYGLLYDEVNNAVKNAKHLEIEDDPELLAEFEKEFGIDFDDLQKQMMSLFEVKKVQELLDLSPYKDRIKMDCLKIIGAVSNKSVHASGIVITSNPIVDLCPTIKKKESQAENGNIINQASEWDMKMLDRSGFLKLDILGLKTLDIIRNALTIAGRLDLDWKHLIPNDEKVLNLFTTGNTTGVFQFDFGSELQRLCTDFKPKTFSDICALTALGRPGAKNFLEQYMINRSKAEHEVEILDTRLIPILKETNYVLAYQEQQMAICKVVAGFSLKEADDLRKIVAKKKVDKIPAMREKFIKGYIANANYDNSDKIGESIWNAYFADCGYLFNKSHAVSYSILSYVTAYLKYYFTVPFMTAVLNNSNDGKREDFADYVYETMRMNIVVKKPDIRHSEVSCSVKDGQCIVGLDTIKDVSVKNSEKLVNNKFSEQNLINVLFNMPKQTCDAIILSGASDGLCGLNRRSLYQSAEFYRKVKAQWKDYDDKMKQYNTRVADMQKKGKASKAKPPAAPAIPFLKPYDSQKTIVEEYSLRELMAQEKEYLGYSPSDPDFKYLPYILNETLCKSKDKDLLKDRQICYIYGVIEDVHVKKDKNQNDMATLEVKPKVSPYNFYITMFASSYGDEETKNLLKVGSSYVFKCEVNEYKSNKTQKLVKSFSYKNMRKAELVWENSLKS